MSNSEWVSLISTVIIAPLIGGGLALAGVRWAQQLQKKDAVDRDTEHMHGLLQAFKAEIETLWEVYRAAAGAHIVALGNNKPMLTYWPLTLEYFTIYNTHAASIGKIEDHELRKQIIATYTKARSMIDSIRMNNDLVKKWEYDQLLFEESNKPVHASNANARLKSLIEYATGLKESHSILESMAADLLRSLQKNIDDYRKRLKK